MAQNRVPSSTFASKKILHPRRLAARDCAVFKPWVYQTCSEDVIRTASIALASGLVIARYSIAPSGRKPCSRGSEAGGSSITRSLLERVSRPWLHQVYPPPAKAAAPPIATAAARRRDQLRPAGPSSAAAIPSAASSAEALRSSARNESSSR